MTKQEGPLPDEIFSSSRPPYPDDIIGEVGPNIKGEDDMIDSVQPDEVFSDFGALMGPIQPDNIISTETVDGNYNKPEEKIISASNLEKLILKLKRANPSDFCYELMLAVSNKSNEKIELELIPFNETLKWYTSNKGPIFNQFVGHTLVKVIILPWCWFDGVSRSKYCSISASLKQYCSISRFAQTLTYFSLQLRKRQQWDEEDEREVKKQMNKSMGSHARSLLHVLNENMEEKYRNKEVLAEKYDNKYLSYGHYEKRPSAFVLLFEVTDPAIIADSLLPGFIDCPTYSYNKKDRKDLPQRIIWNGEVIVSTANLRYVKLKDSPGKYVLIDVATDVLEKRLVINSDGLRDEIVAFYRVGDFLTLDEIKRIIKTCDKFKHAIPTVVLICIKYRHHQLLQRSNQLKAQQKKKKEIKQAKEILQLITEFMHAFREVLCENFFIFSVDEFVRISWVTWSLFDSKYNRMCSDSAQNERRSAKARATKHATTKEEKAQVCEDTKQLDNTIIISITQQGADKSIQRMFRCISHKYDTLESYLTPLEKLTFEEYFEVMVEICRPSCGMYTTRALTILSIIVVSAMLFDGKVPTESIDLLSFWQINEKKANLIRNCMNGVYDGVGVDTHVIQFLKACAALMGVGLSNEDCYRFGKEMPEDPGAYLNEIIGECGQSFKARNNKDDQRWAKWKLILKQVSEKRNEFKQIIDGWLPGWDK